MLEIKIIDILGLLPYGGLLTNLDEGEQSIIRRRMYPFDSWSYFPDIIQNKLNTI